MMSRGRLFTSAPSTNTLPSRRTGTKTPGREGLARTAFHSGPRSSRGARPPREAHSASRAATIGQAPRSLCRGYSSNTTWALTPPKPNECSPARRGVDPPSRSDLDSHGWLLLTM